MSARVRIAVALATAAALLLAVLCAGCAARPLTQLVVVVDSDYAVPAELDNVEVAVQGPSGARQTSTGNLTGPSALTLPVTLTLVPGSDALGPVTITATAKQGARALVAQQVRTQFVRGESLTVRIVLARACEPVRCAADQTCRDDGNCHVIDVPPESLPRWDGGVPPRLDAGPPSDGAPDARDGAPDDVVVADANEDALDDTAPDAPPPTDACATRMEVCNGVDDNCNGMIDEGFDLRTDAANCGHCGVRCGSGYTCAAGVCGDAYPAEVAAAGDTTCVRRINGAVLCWGNNSEGVVGDGTLANRVMPTRVPGIGDGAELDMSAHHACVRHADRTESCWGSNVSGALGDGTTTMRTLPVAVMGLSDAVGLGSGRHHNCARRAAGTVACWGQNGNGQLGDGTTSMRTTPVAVMGLTDATEIDSYGYHTCARRIAGPVVCWGANDVGQLGNGTMVESHVPVTVTGLTDAASIVLGYNFSCALRMTGAVVCWGANDHGQLGDGSPTTTVRTAPGATVTGLTDATTIAVGQYHACARRMTGAVVCWGANDGGQLGDGTFTTRTTPVAVMGLSDAVEVDAGDSHTCARRASRALVCWGANNAGQLGDGTNASHRTPAPVVGLP